MTPISHTARIPNMIRIAGQVFRPCSSSVGDESKMHHQSPHRFPGRRHLLDPLLIRQAVKLLH